MNNPNGASSILLSEAESEEFAVDMGDQLLVERARQDDLEAYEELVNRYRARILNYVARFSGSTTDAEDLAQEVFIKAFVAIKKFRAQSSFTDLAVPDCQ